jgi:hypothetical protein
VIKKCDEAISYAIDTRSGKEESQEADESFEDAIRHLKGYESKFHRYINIISDIKCCIADSLGFEV